MGRLFKKCCPVSNCFTLLFQNCIESRSRRSILLFSIEMGRWVWKWKATKALWHLSAPFYCQTAPNFVLTLKTRHWADFSKNIALYLTVSVCCSKIALSQDLGVVYYCFLLKWVDEYGNEKRQKRCDIWVHLSTAVHWIAQSHSLTLKMVSVPHWQIFMKLLPLKKINFDYQVYL